MEGGRICGRRCPAIKSGTIILQVSQLKAGGGRIGEGRCFGSLKSGTIITQGGQLMAGGGG